MDEIEHETLTLWHKLKWGNVAFIASLHFSHGQIFNNGHN